MKYLYQFAGGEYDGVTMTAEQAEKYSTGFTTRFGGQPTFDGYLGPMRDGIRYRIAGYLKYEWETPDIWKQEHEPITIMRYETQEVYNALCE